LKIVQAIFWTEQIPLTRPYTIAYKTTDRVENIFVRLTDEKGRVGVGVAAPAESVTGESFEACRDALATYLEALVLNKTLSPNLIWAIQQRLKDTPAACAAVDIAIHDLWGKTLDLPLAKLFGQVHTSLPTSITIGIKETIAEAVEEAKEYKDRQFKIIKLKVGLDVEQDIEIITKIKESIGAEMLIRVDANQGYSKKALMQFLQATEKLDVEFVEQPFKTTATKELLSLPENIRKKMAADESLQKPLDAIRHAIPPQAVGIYNIKLMKCGGIRAGLDIGRIAYHGGIDLMWGCMDESCVSISAALHAAFASPNTKYLDLDGSFDLARDPFKGGFTLENGYMWITDKPGLGVGQRE